MPVCAGRPDTGQCPSNTNDNSVTWSICDLFLCPDCYDHRAPSLPTVVMSDNEMNKGQQTACMGSAPVKKSHGLPNVLNVLNEKLVINEVLFYAKGKFSSQTANSLKLVLNSFFTDDEIAVAKELLYDAVVLCKVVDVPRHIRRQGGNRLKLNVDDLVKLLTLIDEQKLMNSLPMYVAANINRLPAVNIDDVDLFVLAKKLEAMETRLLKVEVDRVQAAGQGQVEIIEAVSSSAPTAVVRSAQHCVPSNPPANGGSVQQAKLFSSVVIVGSMQQSAPPSPAAVVGSAKQFGLSSHAAVDAVIQQPANQGVQVGPGNLHKSTPSTPGEASEEWHTMKSRKPKGRQGARIQGTADTHHPTLKSGVVLIKKRVFHIDNLDVNTTVDTVSKFLYDAGVCVLSCYAVKSWLTKRPNALVTSMRVCIKACDSGKILKSSLWPKSVIVRDWKFKKRPDNGRPE